MAHPLRPQGGANIKGGDTASRDSWHILMLSGLALLLPGGLVLLLSGRLALLMPGLEARRAVPGPQTLWLAQDLLLWLAWHALPWVARLALLPELKAPVQQGWFADGRITKRYWSPRSWLETREQTVSRQLASPGPKPPSAHDDGPPVRKGSDSVRCSRRSP